MQTQPITCPNCHNPIAPSDRYCPTCGEAVATDLITELRWLYTSLHDLDERIANGQGTVTITQLRKAYLGQYRRLRRAPATEELPAAPAPDIVAPAFQAPAMATPPAIAQPTPPRVAPSTTGAPQAVAPAHPPVPPVPPTPAGPIFAWREFLQEQAITIMAYLGGFLLLVATLSFEVGAWQFLSDAVKLAIVLIVYGVFGGLGIALRRATRLQTVGRAYLGVFALMTPLVCLAVYRFALQSAHVSGYGMLVISSLYGAVVYLALGWRTRFITYSYLGWAALLVGALAIIPWLALPGDWVTLTLALTALLMLIPDMYRQRADLDDIAAPGVQFAILVTGVALLGTELQGSELWGATFTAGGLDQPAPPSLPAFTLAACALIPLAACWRVVIRRRATPADPAILTLVDWAGVAVITQAVIAIAAWVGVDRNGMTYLLSLLALVEFAVTVVLRRVVVDRRALRFAVDGLGMVLVLVAILQATADIPTPNWALVTALGVGGALALSVTLLENLPAGVLLSGFFCSLAFYAMVGIIAPAPAVVTYPSPVDPVVADAGAVFALGLWSVAMALGVVGRARALAPFTYLVAAVNALYVAVLVITYPNQSVMIQTVILLAFSAAALVAGWREHTPTVGGLALGCFGVLAMIPPTTRSTNGLVIGAAMLGAWVATLIIRRALGRSWLVAPYVIAVWATLLAGSHLALGRGVTTAGWQFLGIPYVAWLLLAAAIPATYVALTEDQPALLAIPALMGLSAVAVTRDPVAPAVLTIALVGVGMALRQGRGRGWSIAWHVAAAFASILAVNAIHGVGASAAYWQAALSLCFAVIAYLVAAQEGAWRLTFVAVVYVVAALVLTPAVAGFWLDLALTGGLAALGVVLHRVFRGEWSLALYTSAIIASIFAVAHVTPFDATHVEGLLLIFAVVAYIVVLIEQRPLAGVIPMLYAATAIGAQPDAHALLPLALVAAVLALIAGQRGGWRWSWPLYAVAVIAALATVGHSQADPPFTALALGVLAIITYIVAAVESRPDVVIGALVTGALAVAATAVAGQWQPWESILAFAALSWLYTGMQWLWRAFPWLRPRGGAWWQSFTGVATEAEERALPPDPVILGVLVHRVSGVVVAAGTLFVAFTLPDSFAPGAASTEGVVIALVSLAGLLALQAALDARWHILRYVAGGAIALAATWQLRWLGADNVQAYILIPGSYQLLIGAVLPSDQRVGEAATRAGHLLSLTGSLTLMLPTLAQSFQSDQNWIYAVILAAEALVIAGLGIGTRSRLVMAAGLAFVGLAAIRGGVLAVDSGVPIALVIGFFALLLMGAATWLSLRSREATS